MPNYEQAQKRFRGQKAALTRAKNSGDPIKVCEAVKKAVKEWNGPIFDGAWPDDWSTWSIAYEDAVMELRRTGHPDAAEWPNGGIGLLDQ